MHERIGKYHVIRAAGSGGFGTVFEGYDIELDRNVAIKICASDDEVQLERFRREARVVSQLKHPNIALVHDFGFDPEAGLHFLVEEFLSGVDLEKKLEERDRLPPSLRIRYLIGLTQGLEFVHNRGLIHRDLSPRNIRVLHDHTIKIMDFGLAKDVTDSTLTLVGDNFGTVGYTAPEQITGMREVDHRTDIFSLGVIAYELLTWSNPFKAESMGSFIHKVNHVEPEPMANLWRGCPPELAEAVHRCFAKAAGERYDSCSEVLPVLKRALRFLREHETPQPLATRNFTGVPEDGVRVVGGDIRIDSSGDAPSFAMPQAAPETTDLNSDDDSTPMTSELYSRGLKQQIGLIVALVALAGIIVLLAFTWRQEAVARSQTFITADSGAPPNQQTPNQQASNQQSQQKSQVQPPSELPAQDPSTTASELQNATLLGAEPAEPGELSRVSLSPKLFELRASRAESPEGAFVILEAVLPSLGELSHCYLIRAPGWSYGAKVRRECEGGRFTQDDRLELAAGTGYTYRIQLAGRSGEVLAEAASATIVLGE